MKTPISIKIFHSISELPEKWDTLAKENIFLRKDFLKTLNTSAPSNIKCFFIGLFLNEELVGISLSQLLDLNQLSTFGERDRCFKNILRNLILKKYCSRILIIGNVMITGNNYYCFTDKIKKNEGLIALLKASKTIESILKIKGIKVNITTLKDFSEDDSYELEKEKIKKYFKFSAQPNMTFEIPIHWKSEQNYLEALSKKYRNQYKRARKKAEIIEKKKLEIEELIKYEEELFALYYNVAKKAHFNTFYLKKNHFKVIKEIFKDNFLVYGYFLDSKLIGFNTIIKNGKTINTYFLGYDESIQQKTMLYLNMLYDMVMFSVNQGFKEIIFSRTAMEIKSSIGAKPQKMYSLAKHNHPIINLAFNQIFNFLEPKSEWTERNPFK